MTYIFLFILFGLSLYLNAVFLVNYYFKHKKTNFINKNKVNTPTEKNDYKNNNSSLLMKSSGYDKDRKIHFKSADFLVPENLTEEEKRILEHFYSKQK